MKRLISMVLLVFMLVVQSTDFTTQAAAASTTYVLNTNTKKFHRPQCSSVKQMKEKNREDTTLSYDEIIKKGYSPCKNCNPSKNDSTSVAGATSTVSLKTSAQNVTAPDRNESAEITYVVNTNTKKFHYSSCSSVSDIKEKNRRESTKSRDQLISDGYVPCKRCNP